MSLPSQIAALYPWTGHHLEVDGGRMHYLDEGPRDAPVLFALHGNPTWSFYWRRVVARFSGRYRVVVPDHIGCGLSDKPQGWTYRLADHIGNARRLLDHLGLDRVTFVVHDWGGAIGMGVATQAPERAVRFVVTNTAAFHSIGVPPSILACRIPGFGALAVRGFNGFAGAATFRAVSKRLDPAVKAGLLYPYHSWASRIATLRFVEDIPLSPTHPSWATIDAIDAGLAGLRGKPMQIIWGEDDFCFTPDYRAVWERRFPDAGVLRLAAGHYVLEDEPDAVLGAMDHFLQQTEGASR